jgi:hypothetical protein
MSVEKSMMTFLVVAALLLWPATVGAQTAGIPDLSGDWQHAVVVNLGGGNNVQRGSEPGIPYVPEARTRMMAEMPATGADGQFERNTDPYIHYCEPLGLVRMFGYPGKSRFIQTAEAVYILDENGPTFRVVWLNAKHPDDPDPQYLGHSIGWYEGGNTLVVDTVGTNGKTWLDQAAHTFTEQAHFVERFSRVDRDTLSYEFTIDDPGSYSKPWGLKRNFRRSDTGFLRYQWVCSVRDTYEHYEKVGKQGTVGDTTFK